jgi:hypothetical protein
MEVRTCEALHKSGAEGMARIKLVVLGLATLLALSGCTPGEPAVAVNDRVAAEDRAEEAPAEGEGGGGGGGGGTPVDFSAGTALEYTQVPDSLPAGPVVVNLTCEILPHIVVFEGINGDQPLVQCEGEGTVNGEETAELESGATVVYYCSIAGHRPAGMEGELTVQ